MNRAYKRKFVKAAKKRGVDETIADVYLRLKENGMEKMDIRDGDRVRLNLKSIQAHPDYPRLSVAYRQFVEENAETVFTAKYGEDEQAKSLVCLKEDSIGWHFWPGDLIKVSE